MHRSRQQNHGWKQARATHARHTQPHKKSQRSTTQHLSIAGVHSFIADRSTVQLLLHSQAQTTNSSWSAQWIPTHHAHCPGLVTALQLQPSLGAAQFHCGRRSALNTQFLVNRKVILIALHVSHALLAIIRPTLGGIHVPRQSDCKSRCHLDTLYRTGQGSHVEPGWPSAKM